MLVLFRKIGETFYIDTPGGQIKLTVIALYQNGVRLGINAPKEYNIYREELLEQLQQAQDSTSGSIEEGTLKVEYKSPLLQRLASKLQAKKQVVSDNQAESDSEDRQ
ncbi:MAG: carbon storage regulator [Deltaproteobacteria bacterium]|nr:carbon storage regulator [Deltaproteobacteria bacterium]